MAQWLTRYLINLFFHCRIKWCQSEDARDSKLTHQFGEFITDCIYFYD